MADIYQRRGPNDLGLAMTTVRAITELETFIQGGKYKPDTLDEIGEYLASSRESDRTLFYGMFVDGVIEQWKAPQTISTDEANEICKALVNDIEAIQIARINDDRNVTILIKAKSVREFLCELQLRAMQSYLQGRRMVETRGRLVPRDKTA